MTGLVASGLDAQQQPPPAQGQAAAAGTQTTPAPAPTAPRPPSPETAALNAAMALAPEARITALEKLRTDFPQSPMLSTADSQLLITLAGFPTRTDEMNKVLDRILARTPESATPENKLVAIVNATSTLITRKVLLDRVEKLLKDAVDACGTSETPNVGRGFESLARLYAAKGDKARAEERYKDAVRANPALQPAVLALVEIYKSRGDNAGVETLYKNAIKASTTPTAAQGPTMQLVDFYSKNGNLAGAETLLKELITNLKNAPAPAPPPGAVIIAPGATTPPAAAGTAPPAAGATPAGIVGGAAPAIPAPRANLGPPTFALAEIHIKQNRLDDAEALLKEFLAIATPANAALIAQAKIDEKRGNSAAALDRYMNIAITGALRGADYDGMVALYTKTNGSAAGLDNKLDALYRAKLPNPVKPEHWKATDARSKRLVLLELFTGSGCPPCVASDLAFDALLERYPSAEIVPLVYHEHIPAPDPMTSTDTNTRRLYYNVTGVPTFEIDGVMVAGATGNNMGGGGRDRAPVVYGEYINRIDKQLEAAPKAAVSVNGAVQGDSVSVTATVSNLPTDAKDLRLHIILAERELRFGGENGIRFHPMVVRGIAGEKAGGIPIAANGTFKHTFNLQVIRDDITKFLAEDIAKRRETSPTATFAAENRAMTNMNTSEFVVVAYVQAADKTVLQATKADVTGGASEKAKGGSR
jgi:tetratricopeptide (TPR) repeat protein